jgi:FkbH-like protein
MEWLPAVENFRQALQSAGSAGSPQAKLGELAHLARHRLGFIETLQLDRALAGVGTAKADGFTSLRVALVGSATLNQLEPGIRVAGLRHRLLFEVKTGSYGQYRQEILSASSFLREFTPDIVLLSLTASDVLGSVPLTASAAEVDAVVTKSVGDLQPLWRAIRENSGAAVIQQTFPELGPFIFGSFDRTIPGSPLRLVACLNERLAETARDDNVPLLDLATQIHRDGIDAWFDARHWLHAKQEIKPEAAPLFGELFARVVAAQRGASRKCLVLDLDNTLWGGVIGDDGIDGIVLGQGSAVGEAHLALQRYAKQQKERGIILAVCSKNDPAVAERAFREHPEMLLKRSDISAFAANWEDKAANLARIAKELNIGVDSLVFVDDNPIERARIRQALPAVAVPELPKDPAYYARVLADAGYFEAVSFTPEDRERTELIARDAERSAFLSVSQSMDDFLRGLEMAVVHGPVAKGDLARVTQLINKTNQFNTTTRRYTLDEIAGKAASPDCLALQFRLLDRYGDNGLVSTVILNRAPEPQALEIESWVMSCRVFGRELEFEAMNIVVEAARHHGAGALVADYIPTTKNAIIKGLYQEIGFAPVDPAGAEDGRSRWQLDLAAYAGRKTHIARREAPR